MLPSCLLYLLLSYAFSCCLHPLAISLTIKQSIGAGPG